MSRFGDIFFVRIRHLILIISVNPIFAKLSIDPVQFNKYIAPKSRFYIQNYVAGLDKE